MTYPIWDDSHARRVRAMIHLKGSTMVLLGAAWCAGGLMIERQMLALFNGLLALTGASLLVLACLGRLRTATIVTAHLTPLLLCALCLLDNPAPGVPRSTHLFFLAIAAGSYFVFRRDDTYLRLILPAAYLVAFLVFALTPLRLSDPALIIPPWADWPAAWVNTVSAVFALVVTIVLMHADLTDRRSREAELRRAIARAEFVLHYQPQVDRNGWVTGAEALVRWHHPKRGEVGPDDFIPLAEESGLIVPIGDFVLRAACAQLARWHARPETAHLTLSVNISASQFLQPDFVPNLLETVRRSGARPRQLTLELTESMLVGDMAATAARMQALRESGIVWALDDLGTGYSSLRALSGLPFGQIKIDQSFVAAMARGAADMHIIEAVTTLSRRLSLALVAEGVETPDQFRRLVEAGCQGFQGYLFGPAVEITTFEATLPDASAARTAAAI